MDQAANLRKLALGFNKRESSILLDPRSEKQQKGSTHTIRGSAINNFEEKQTRIISITSGKGGVGKTAFSVNLAISLAKKGLKVLLFDGDLGLANINVLLGIIPEHNIYEVMRGKKRVEEVIISTSYGIDIIAGGNGISQLANLTNKQREFFLKGLESLSGYDVMIIDTGAGVGDNVIDLVVSADDIIIVATPEPTSMTDAYGMIKSIVANNKRRAIKLVVNRAASSSEARRVSDRLSDISEQFLNTKIESIGYILEDILIQKSIRNQRPHVILHPGARSSVCIKQIASRLFEERDAVDQKGVSGFFKKLLGFNNEAL